MDSKSKDKEEQREEEGENNPKRLRRDEGAACRFTDRESLNSVCGSNSNGAIRLLKASCIIALYNNHKILPRRQELPEEAFWDKAISKKTTIVVVSCPWLSAQHIDPDGQHLAVLAPLLSKFVEHEKKENGLPDDDIAVFIDWTCLYQEERTAHETLLFHNSLKDVALLYGHARTVAWFLTKIPSRADWNQSYDGRGWCVFEHRIASIIKTGNRLLNVGMLEIAPDEVTDFRKQVEILKLERKAPLLPEEFRDELCEKTVAREYKYEFTNESDRDVVIERYGETFDEVLSEVDRLEFNRLGWSDEDVLQLVKILPSCVRLKSLLLHSNNFGDDTARALCRVLPDTVEQLDGRNNNLSFDFDSEEPYPYGERNFYDLSKAQRSERVEWRKRYLGAFKRYYVSAEQDEV